VEGNPQQKEVHMKILGTRVNAGGLTIGAGAVLLAPVVLPVVGAILRPLLKSAIKGGILAYEGARVSVEEAKEMVEDLAAEAKAEMAEAAEKK
jgi:hypothetical protein